MKSPVQISRESALSYILTLTFIIALSSCNEESEQQTPRVKQIRQLLSKMIITEPWNVGQKISECIYQYNADSSLKKLTNIVDINGSLLTSYYDYSYSNGRLSLISIGYDSSTPVEEYQFEYSSIDSPYPTKIIVLTTSISYELIVSGTEGSISRITNVNGENRSFVEVDMENNIILGTERNLGTTLPELRKYENSGFFNPLYFEDQIVFMPSIFLPGFATFTKAYSKLLPTAVYAGDDFSDGKVYEIEVVASENNYPLKIKDILNNKFTIQFEY